MLAPRGVARVGLWTPCPIDASCIPEIPGIAAVEAWSGEAKGAVLPWGETERWRRVPLAGGEAPADWIDALWRIPPAEEGAAARANHRGFAFDLAERLGCALPHAFRANSLRDFNARVADLEGPWVAKAPWSAAGRERAFGEGAAAGTLERRLARLIERFGEVIVEPWMARTADFGLAGFVSPDAHSILGVHSQRVDARGQFAAIIIDDSLHAEERRRLLDTARAAADELRAIGYLGPFGIDAWRYRRQDGGEHFHPLGEINARLTFGIVARAWTERMRAVLDTNRRAGFTLELGRARDAVSTSQGEVPLLYDRERRPLALLKAE